MSGHHECLLNDVGLCTYSTFGAILTAKPRQDAVQAIQAIESFDRL